MSSIFHGTNIATNPVIQRTPSKVALITTNGFKYVLEIGRHDIPRRENIYAWVKPERPVPPNLIFEVAERIDRTGTVRHLLAIPPAGENNSVRAGDIPCVETCGGGGWGDPCLRDVRDVRRDVVGGFITVESAARDYGVVVNGSEHQIGEAATRELREQPVEAPPYVHRGANGDMRLERLGISP